MHKIDFTIFRILLFIPPQKYTEIHFHEFFIWMGKFENLFIMEIYELKIFSTHSNIIHETIIIDAENFNQFFIFIDAHLFPGKNLCGMRNKFFVYFS
jgi:hypothetical protein